MIQAQPLKLHNSKCNNVKVNVVSLSLSKLISWDSCTKWFSYFVFMSFHEGKYKIVYEICIKIWLKQNDLEMYSPLLYLSFYTFCSVKLIEIAIDNALYR